MTYRPRPADPAGVMLGWLVILCAVAVFWFGVGWFACKLWGS